MKKQEKTDWWWSIKDFFGAVSFLLIVFSVFLVAVGYPYAIGVPLLVGILYVGFIEDIKNSK